MSVASVPRPINRAPRSASPTSTQANDPPLTWIQLGPPRTITPPPKVPMTTATSRMTPTMLEIRPAMKTRVIAVLDISRSLSLLTGRAVALPDDKCRSTGKAECDEDEWRAEGRCPRIDRAVFRCHADDVVVSAGEAR